jgi:hypothetical protein
MTDLVSYINQSKYNEKIARFLLNSTKFLDWSITVAFYSAIHFVNAGLCFDGLEINYQTTNNDDSIHAKRQKLVQSKYGNNCYKSYRNLRVASNKVRYLEQYSGIDEIPSLSYYEINEVKDFIEIDLKCIKDEILKKSKFNPN